MKPAPDKDGRCRVVIESISPTVDGGRFAVKRLIGELIVVTADIFADGHDVVCAELRRLSPGANEWVSSPMRSLGNDAWQSEFQLNELGEYVFEIEAWVDHFQTWLRDLRKRLEARQDVAVELAVGSAMVTEAASRARAVDAPLLQAWSAHLRDDPHVAGKLDCATLDELAELLSHYPDKSRCVISAPHRIVVDRPLAQCGAWYEMFPRSASPIAGAHGTLSDVIARLPYVALMGFDVLYLPPIHPIGRQFRKGRNNSVNCEPGEPGVPWAIGAEEGGHTAIHPQLGTLTDLRNLVAACKEHRLELAIDIAFQCAPDHPYVREHADWFRRRPDGTIQYAENPPKKYQDIYPFDFESEDWRSLWQELTRVVEYWCQQGVRIFRVDNPHTKPFGFWEYLIGEIRRGYPDAIFLSEAFTRPKVMLQLAKLGFTQSYTYFTWRNTKAEFIEYLTELTSLPVRDFFRPNFWPNTPDILPEHLQTGGRSAFEARLILAATLAANYGIYGPAFELQEHAPREPGSEEYLNSEKYEIKTWELERADSLSGLIGRVNRIRRENAALQQNDTLHFHHTDNDKLLCYSKRSTTTDNVMLMVVNLDFRSPQHGFVHLDLAELGVADRQSFTVHDLFNQTTFTWQGARNFVELDPAVSTAHLFRIGR